MTVILYELYIYFVIFVFGTVMGSFLNVVAVRLSKEESIIWPCSHCDSCNHKLKWYENIPIISYLFQKGRCNSCNAKIPISSLLMEVVTGVLYCTSYHSFGFSYEFVISLIFISSLITVIVADIEYMIIPDEVIGVSGIIIIVLELIFYGLEYTSEKIISGILAFIIMYVIKLIGDKLFKKESMGGGDIKLMFLFGIVIGFSLSICNIFLATFIAFPVAIFLLISRKDSLIPFGPFLAMAAILMNISKISIDKIINVLIK